MSNWKWLTKPKVIEGELFDEPDHQTGVPLYKQWLYVLIPLTIWFFIWMFGENIRRWWISSFHFTSPKEYHVKRVIRQPDAETIRDAITL